MSEEPWKKWTPQFMRDAADDTRNTGFPPWAEMLDAFAALLEAEQRGDRCVLPVEVAAINFEVWKSPKGWICIGGKNIRGGRGDTQEAAILDLARKLRAR